MKDKFVSPEQPVVVVIDPAPRLWVLAVVFVLVTLAVIFTAVAQAVA